MDQGNFTCPSVGSDGASGLAVNSPEQSPFLRLPPEIRNIIYDVSLHWPDSKTLYSGYNEQIKEYYVKKHAGVDAEFPVYSGRLSTPTILLLCKAITAECLGILKSRKLVIDRLPPWLPGAKRPMRISQFVGTATLQNLRFLEIHPAFGLGKLGSGWVWSGVVKELVEILLVRNTFEQVRFVLCFHDMHKRVEPLWTQENRCYCKIFKKMMKLRKQNPTFWAPGHIDIEIWHVHRRVALNLTPQKRDRRITDGSDIEARYYPDPYIWQSSLLEFL